MWYLWCKLLNHVSKYLVLMSCSYPVCLQAVTVPFAGLRWPASNSWPARISPVVPCPASFGPGDGWCEQLRGPGTCRRPGRPRGRWTHICWVQEKTQRRQTIVTLKYFFLHNNSVLSDLSLLHYKTCLHKIWLWFILDKASVKYMCQHELNGLCVEQFLIKGGEHRLTPQVVRPWGEMSLGGWDIKRKEQFRNVFSSLDGTPPAFKCGWPWTPYWLTSRLNGFVEQCYCHKTKKPGFNGLVSPHECCVQGSFQLGTVEVVFDQLLSAWLGVNRWTNH